MHQGRLDAAVEQRVAEGAAAAQDLSSVRAELDAAREAASEADAAVLELRGGLDAARAREQEQQRLLREMQVRHLAPGDVRTSNCHTMSCTSCVCSQPVPIQRPSDVPLVLVGCWWPYAALGSPLATVFPLPNAPQANNDSDGYT